jgi:hypothetical protein
MDVVSWLPSSIQVLAPLHPSFGSFTSWCFTTSHALLSVLFNRSCLSLQTDIEKLYDLTPWSRLTGKRLHIAPIASPHHRCGSELEGRWTLEIKPTVAWTCHRDTWPISTEQEGETYFSERWTWIMYSLCQAHPHHAYIVKPAIPLCHGLKVPYTLARGVLLKSCGVSVRSHISSRSLKKNTFRPWQAGIHSGGGLVPLKLSKGHWIISPGVQIWGFNLCNGKAR